MNEKTKHRILLALITLSTIPFFFAVKHPAVWSVSAENAKMLATYFSSSLGYIGVSLLVWELILGTRAVAGLFFSDLVSKLKLHRQLGTYGAAFVFLHPLLIMYAYSESLLYVIEPDFSSTANTAITYGRVAFVLLLIVWFTSAIVRGKIAYRPWKYIHYLSYPLLLLSFLHVPQVGSSFGGTFIQFYWYSAIAISLVCIALRMRHIFGFGKVAYKVVKRADPTPDITVFRLQAEQKNLGIKTGQYVYLQPSLWAEEHPFTVLDHNLEQGYIDIAFKRFGSFTKKLQRTHVGESLYVEGPYGTFMQEKLNNTTLPSVYIAGGIGITPFVKYALAEAQDQHSYMFYANQARHTAAFRDILKSSLGHRFVDVFSRETKHAPEQNVEHGYVSGEVIQKYIKQPEKYQYFICGPEGMIHAAKQALLDISVPAGNIHAEEFGF